MRQDSRLLGSRLSDVQDPIIPKVQSWVLENPGTISLGQGIVSYGPPQEALQALADFGQAATDHRYGPVGGDPELKSLLIKKLREENGLVLGPEQAVFVSAGSNMAFFEILLAITAPGDEVILPVPFYFNQDMAIRMLGCTPIAVATRPDFSIDHEAMARSITPRTRAIVTVSPNNPSGQVYSEADLRAVNQLCRDHGLFHLSDEAYEYFIWGDRPHFSPASISGSESFTIGLYSLSKTFGFAGWRVGYMVIPAVLVPDLVKIQDTNLICPPRPSQRAAVGALRVGRSYFDQQAHGLVRLREEVLTSLITLGPLLRRLPQAEGAFYVFLDVDTTLSGLELAERLACEYGVAVVPGEAFGMLDGCYLRVAYGAPNPEAVREGVRRLVAGIRAICGRP
jgi:aspartate/methionine/tyrosine aminotransferase